MAFMAPSDGVLQRRKSLRVGEVRESRQFDGGRVSGGTAVRDRRRERLRPTVAEKVDERLYGRMIPGQGRRQRAA